MQEYLTVQAAPDIQPINPHVLRGTYDSSTLTSEAFTLPVDAHLSPLPVVNDLDGEPLWFSIYSGQSGFPRPLLYIRDPKGQGQGDMVDNFLIDENGDFIVDEFGDKIKL